MSIKTEKMPGKQRNRPLKDYAGSKFGRLTAIELVRRMEGGNHLWRFGCDCGNVVVKGVALVRKGHTSSCGCLRREALVNRNSTHGLSQANRVEYRSWKDMRARCNTPTNSDYGDYGGRGIRVCPKWDDFGAFLASMGKRSPGATLDRIDVNGHYEPSNCRWADATEQANNKRTNRVIEMRGERKTLQQWCRELGFEHSKVQYRLRIGMSPDDAFSAKDFRKHGNSEDRHG